MRRQTHVSLVQHHLVLPELLVQSNVPPSLAHVLPPLKHTLFGSQQKTRPVAESVVQADGGIQSYGLPGHLFSAAK